MAIETCNILGRCHNAEGYQAYIICESSCQGKGSLLFEVPRSGGGFTTRKIDSCTFVANDTLGPKGREAYFLGAYAERIANLTCTLSIDQWHEQQFGDMLVVGEHKREESNFFGAYRLKDGR